MDNVEVAKSVFAIIAVCGIAILCVVGGIILPIKLIVSYIGDGEWTLALLVFLIMAILLSIVALCIMEVIYGV